MLRLLRRLLQALQAVQHEALLALSCHSFLRSLVTPCPMLKASFLSSLSFSAGTRGARADVQTCSAHCLQPSAYSSLSLSHGHDTVINDACTSKHMLVSRSPTLISPPALVEDGGVLCV